MSYIYLASSIAQTGEHIGKFLNEGAGKTLSLVFITTAGETDAGDREWLVADRAGLVAGGFDVTDYTITGKTPDEIESDLEPFDVIHVNGGNSFYLLIQAVKSGFDRWIAKAVASGKTYIGSSAGAITASPDISITSKLETEFYAKKIVDYEKKGFGLVDVLILPHWGSDNFKDLYMDRRLELAYKPENKIVLLNDYQYLFTLGDGNFDFVDVREGA